MNYSRCDYDTELKTNSTNCLKKKTFKKCNPPMPFKQPILFQNETDVCNPLIMQVGPERTNHTCENIWDNVTNRKYISY